jgi:diacylglycerol kinase (ATP)
MGKPGATGVRRIINATGYSVKGIRAAWQHESAFRQESVLCLVMFPLAIWLGRTPLEYAILIGSLLLVIIVELLNSAIEAVVDRVGDQINELSGRSKDMGSAAVMFSLANVLLCWGMIAWARFS